MRLYLTSTVQQRTGVRVAGGLLLMSLIAQGACHTTRRLPLPATVCPSRTSCTDAVDEASGEAVLSLDDVLGSIHYYRVHDYVQLIAVVDGLDELCGQLHNVRVLFIPCCRAPQ